MNTKTKAPPPELPRSTSWTAERIAKLNMIEVRQLKDNALRLGEPEIAALCDAAMTQLRRDSLAARKAAPKKPPPRKVAVKVPEDS
jgi:hypothetical protein